MPLYEYRCERCDRHNEVIQKFSDRPLETCQHCGGKLERLLSAPAIQFKGSGWYITDYARKNGANGASKKDESSPKAESSSSSASSVKTDTPKASKPD